MLLFTFFNAFLLHFYFAQLKSLENAFISNAIRDGGAVVQAKSTVSIEAVAQWYSQRTSVFEIAGSIPAPVIVELF